MYMLWNDLKVIFMINETLFKLHQIKQDFFFTCISNWKELSFLIMRNWDTWYNEWYKKKIVISNDYIYKLVTTLISVLSTI